MRLQQAPADQGAGQRHEGLVQFGAPFIATAQAVEWMQLRQRPFDDREAALADRSKDQRAIARALNSFGPSGATLNDITAAAGLRRDDVLAGLKALLEVGQVVREKSLAANGAGRPRKIYRAAQFNSVPDRHNDSGT